MSCFGGKKEKCPIEKNIVNPADGFLQRSRQASMIWGVHHQERGSGWGDQKMCSTDDGRRGVLQSHMESSLWCVYLPFLLLFFPIKSNGSSISWQVIERVRY